MQISIETPDNVGQMYWYYPRGKRSVAWYLQAVREGGGGLQFCILSQIRFWRNVNQYHARMSFVVGIASRGVLDDFQCVGADKEIANQLAIRYALHAYRLLATAGAAAECFWHTLEHSSDSTLEPLYAD